MEEKIKRWRLILGKELEEEFDNMGMGNLSEEEQLIDQTLTEIYGTCHANVKSDAKMRISKWIGDVKRLFDDEIAMIVQNDAIEKKGLKQLLLEPEVLETIEPSVEIAATLLTLKNQIPEKSKIYARQYMKRIVEEINKKMKQDMVRTIHSAINKREHSPLPSATSIDYKRTIAKNLKNYDKSLHKIIPEKVYFYDRKGTKNRWHIILDIDQSGSMGESILYSSILSCILASISALKVNVVAFDTEIMDLSDLCQDPVELLFGFQMGGGTDIYNSIQYCQRFIENPSKTIFFLVSDLDEGGNMGKLLQRLETMKANGVLVVVLLAISDDGTPYYNHYVANKIAKMDIPCMAISPNHLPELIEKLLKKQPIDQMGYEKLK